MPWIASDLLMCPLTKMDNGLIDVLYSEKISRSSIISTFIEGEKGAGIMMKGMSHQRVKAFVLEPGSYTVGKGNEKTSQVDLLEDHLDRLILDVSGERVPYSTIQVEVLPSVMNCIVPGHFDPSRWEKNFQRDFPGFKQPE